MPAFLLATRRVEKPWGRHRLWPGFADPAADGAPVGEIWFQAPAGAPADLLVKYLFTGEKLSVQVHPDDDHARAHGLAHGKDECWLILDAAPDSTIALGPREPVAADALRAAALDGTIEARLDWKPVRPGDFLYVPAGTIHAIGAGITLIEVQQNSDTTYRLYDYGRPRDLHLDDALAVAHRTPYVAARAPAVIAPDRMLLVEGPKFVLERRKGGRHDFTLPPGVAGWLVVVAGDGVVDGVAFGAGECLRLDGACALEASMGSDLLLAYPGTAQL